MSIQSQFSPQELEAIREATREAEQRTGGELVCVIVQQADVYESSVWKAATLGALGGTVGAGLWVTFTDFWAGSLLPWILVPAAIGAAIGTLLIWAVPAVRRALIPSPVMDLRVDRRAAVAYLQEEIFATRDRTGVLLFVSLFEHGIRILCDRGIEERVPEEAWNSIVEDLARGLRSGPKGPAIEAAVKACGSLLEEYCISRRLDDEDELDNVPRLYDE